MVDNTAVCGPGEIVHVMNSCRTDFMPLKLLSRSISAQFLLIAFAILGILPDPYDVTSFRGLTLIWTDSSASDPFEDINDSSDQVCGSVLRREKSGRRAPGVGSPEASTW